MASIGVRGLNARYGKKEVLHELDAEIADGEFFVILGPSGAGKTTTLKCVAGLLDGAGGTVHIGGRDMTGVEPYERNVAMAFESYALYPQKTVEENLASPLKSGRLGTWTAEERTRRIKEVTDTLGIGHLLARYPKELSNGQRQRTALGRVLVRPADAYLLDEPLSHLDAKLRATMRTELKQLRDAARTTTVYVTHDYQEALALGDRVAVLRDGRFVQTGPPAEIWNAPHDTFVARSLGQPEMNLLPAEATGDGRTATTAGGSATVGLPGPATEGDGNLLLGIRPRDLTAAHATEPAPDPDGGASGSPPGRLTLRGRVVLAERLGRSIELSVETGAGDGPRPETVIAVTDDPTLTEGAEITLTTDWERVHVFASRPGSPYPLRTGAARPAGEGTA